MSNGVDDVLAKRNRSKADRENIGDVGWNDKIKEKDNEMGVRVTSPPPQNRVLAITKHVERSVCSLGITIRVRGMGFGIREGYIVV
jgi:hypothetical protein